MHFLADLDGLTQTLTVVTILLNLLLVGIAWSKYINGEPRNLRYFVFGLSLSLFCIAQVRDAYCPDADQPHLRVTGGMTYLSSYTYHANKSRYTGAIVCVKDCSGNAPQMELSEIASRVLHGKQANDQLTVVYLKRVENPNTGNGTIMISHPVVEIDDPATGQQIYYKDTTRHWPRVIVLLANAMFGVLSFLLILWMGRQQSTTGESDSGDASSDDSQPIPNDLTGLGLRKSDRSEAS